MKMAYLTMIAGLCAIASCVWGGIRLHEKGGAENTYRISPTERMTVVAKRVPQKPVVTPGRMSAPQESGSPETARELPDGCESAFSPFVEPGNVIGRCVS